MQQDNIKWTPSRAIQLAQQEIDSLSLPNFKVDLNDREDLTFSSLTNYTNKELEDFLTMYGGYKGYLETRVADIEAIVGVLDASFNESYHTALFKVTQEYDEQGEKTYSRRIKGRDFN